MGEPACKMPYADFLNWESQQPIRHEFVAGECFAMTGGTDRHNTVAGNFYVMLRQRLRGGPCRVFMADVQLRVDSVDAAFYPDVMVTCSEADRSDPRVKRHPCLIAEILSPTTATYDIGHKFACYRQIESLTEYLLIDPVERRIELFRHETDGRWVLHPAAAGDRLHLLSIGIELVIDDLYEDL